MNIPSKSDWGDVSKDLDTARAFKHFFGITFREAVGLFEENALFYQEDLMWMPPAPFNFYAPAFAQYLQSEKAKGDADAASTFLNIITWWLETNKQLINKDTERLLLSAAEEIAQNQDFYEADTETYGSFNLRLKKIKKLI